MNDIILPRDDEEDIRYKVYIAKVIPKYPSPPFSPSIRYPEYLFDDISPVENQVYQSIREAFMTLGLDKENFNTKKWNPLGAIIKQNDVVLIKPNLVSHNHLERNIFAVITHASLIRAVIDYVLISLDDQGKIILADSPEGRTDFREALKASGIEHIIKFYKENGVSIEIRDLRRERVYHKFGVIVHRNRLNGDPEGYRLINLGEHSAFSGLPLSRLQKLYGADYNRRETIAHHIGARHEYEFANTALKADVIINIPKLKNHGKAGFTLCLKNFIGCIGNKNLIPHRTLGDPTTGGDSYPYPPRSKRGKLIRWLRDTLTDTLLTPWSRLRAVLFIFIFGVMVLLFRPPKEDLYNEGNWHGNDTVWRSILDIARIMYYADKNGELKNSRQRKFICVVDGIYGGQREGPLMPELRRSGCIVVGFDPLAVDIVCSRLVGFDFKKIKYLSEALKPHKYDISLDLKRIKILSNERRFENLFEMKREETLCFEPHEMWKGKIELDN